MDNTSAEEKPKISHKRKKVSQREGIKTHTSPVETPQKKRFYSEEGTMYLEKSKVKCFSGQKAIRNPTRLTREKSLLEESQNLNRGCKKKVEEKAAEVEEQGMLERLHQAGPIYRIDP